MLQSAFRVDSCDAAVVGVVVDVAAVVAVVARDCSNLYVCRVVLRIVACISISMIALLRTATAARLALFDVALLLAFAATAVADAVVFIAAALSVCSSSSNRQSKAAFVTQRCSKCTAHPRCNELLSASDNSIIILLA